MRKDAKIGFAIGGVLLAVLTVYVLVVPSHKKTAANSGVTFATGPGAPEPSVSIPPVTSTDSTAPKPADADKPADKPVVARNDGVNWERILGGSGDAPTLKTSTPASPADSTVSASAAAPADASPVAAAPSPAPDMSLSAVAPVAPTRVASVSQSPATQSAGSRTYTIKPGETLSTVAAAVYGNSRFYVAIKRANPKIDPNRLTPGMKIILPDISDVKPEAARDGIRLAAETSSPASTGKTYTVQSGDTLYRISKNLYGSPKQADVLYELNKNSIGPDKARLKLGMVLRLPGLPTANATASTR